MTAKTFELQIELGNSAMRTRFDVAKALEDTTARLRAAVLTADSPTKIFDVNGNSVGTYQFKEK